MIWLLACTAREPERVQVEVEVHAAGRSAVEVEALVVPVEAALAQVALRIESTSWDQRGRVEAWMPPGELDLSGLASSMPDDVQLFLKRRDQPSQRGTVVVVDPDPGVARTRAEELADAAARTPCIAEVQVHGGEPVVEVRVSPEKLVAYGLTMSQVVAGLSSESVSKSMVGSVPLVDVATLSHGVGEQRASWDGTPAVLVEVIGQGCADGVGPLLAGDDAVWTPASTDVRVDLGWANPRDVAELEQAAFALGAQHVLTRWSGEQGPVRLTALAEAPAEVHAGLRTVAAGHPGSDARVRWDGRPWRQLVVTGPREQLLEVADRVESVAASAGLAVDGARVPSRPVTEVEVDREAAARFGMPVREVALATGTHLLGDVALTLGDGDWQTAVVSTPSGAVPLTAVADVVRTLEPVALTRFDGVPGVALYVQAPERQDLQAVIRAVDLPEGVTVREW